MTSSNKASKWGNFGDVNPIEDGGFFIRQNIEENVERINSEYEVVDITNMSGFSEDIDERYLISIGMIDLQRDDWIDWDSVKSLIGEESVDTAHVPIHALIQGAYAYYGAENFGGYHEAYSEKEALDLLEELGITQEDF